MPISSIYLASKYYDLLLGKSFIFGLLLLFISWVGNGIGIVAAGGGEKLGWVKLAEMPPEDARRFLMEWKASRDKSAQPLPAVTNLKELHDELTKERSSLDTRDAAAVNAYNEKVKRYEELRKQAVNAMK
jgi:hypothetical protein